MSKRNRKVAECKECNQAKSFNYYSSEGHWRGLLVGLMQPIHRTGGPQTDCLPKPMSKLIRYLGRESKTHPSTKVSDSMHHGSNICMVVYAWRRLSVMKGRTIKVVRARRLTREVVLLAHHKKMNMSSYEEGSCRLVSI